MLAGIITAIVEGFIRPLLQWWANKQQGVQEERLAERERRDELERRVLAALERDRALRSGSFNADELRDALDHRKPPPPR